MNTLQHLSKLGQSLWLDSISRPMLDDGRLERYVRELGVTGLTSNPTIFDEAIGTGAYDAEIARKTAEGRSGEALFTELALDDLRRAAQLFRPVFDRTQGVDGWVSMELSPLLAADTAGSVSAAARIHRAAALQNLFVKIPGTREGLGAIEQSIFDGIPINVTLLFSPAHYLACANAYLRGIERRIAAGRSPVVASVASLFVSRWDKAVADQVPAMMRNRLGIAIAQRTYVAYLGLYSSARWKELAAAGARPQRLLWASTGTKDKNAPESLYAEAFAAPDTVDTLPEKTLLALSKLESAPAVMSPDGGDSEHVLDAFANEGVDIDALAERLQVEGAEAFVKSWNHLMRSIADKGSTLAKVVNR
jgi:transaldolase